jgi:hypothetical protein
MAEALALASGVIAVAQLIDRVISLCCQFFGKEKDVAQTITTITALKGFLEFLERFALDDRNSARLLQLNSICQPGGPLDMCAASLKDMEAKLQAKKDDIGILKAIAWPFKSKDIAATLEIIERQKTTIMLALQDDVTQTTLAIETAVVDIKQHNHDQSHKNILQWLTKVDPSSNHNEACKKHEPGTGEWFINSHEFSYWMLPGCSLWLHGIPGAGKTVLCSTIIENVKKRCSPESHCIYFWRFNQAECYQHAVFFPIAIVHRPHPP